jgi:AcrR family transcriptional regulator
MYYLTPIKEEQFKTLTIRAAQKLFQRFGLNKTSMEDIANAMGRGKSTLYNYYRSKDEIFTDVINFEIEEVFKKTNSAIEQVVTAEEKLKVYISVSLKAVKSKGILYNTIRNELLNNVSQVSLPIKMFNTKEVNAIKEILSLGITNEEFTDSLKPEIDLLAYSIVSALRSLAFDMVLENKFPNWDERLNGLIKIIIKGVRK